MKKTITLSISKKDIAKGAGKVATCSTVIGYGALEGLATVGCALATKLLFKNPIIVIGLCCFEGFAIGAISNILWDDFYDSAIEFGENTEEIVGHLLGVDTDTYEENKEDSSENRQFSVIG